MILAALVASSLTITGVTGEILRPLEPSGTANVLVFSATDCPVSNGYAPEIRRICSAYAAKGIGCVLIYEDVGATTAAIRAHMADYGYTSLPAAFDADGAVAAAVGATMTPEVALV